MQIVMQDSIVEGKILFSFFYFEDKINCFCFFFYRNFWGFKKHFPDLADQMYQNFDSATLRAIDKERDNPGQNGTGSMSASLRGSNSSLNSMPGVISTCWAGCMQFFIIFFILFYFCDVL